MQLNRAILALSALFSSISALPHLGPRDIEKGILVITVPTKTVTQCLPPTQSLPYGITAPTGKPCPSGSICLPPLGPWPLRVSYYHKPPSRYSYGHRPVRVANGPFPAIGGHSWVVPYQQYKICGTGSLPTPTGMSGTAVPVGTGLGTPTTTWSATDSTPVSSCVSGAACPTGNTGANVPADLGDAAPSDVSES